MRIADEAAEQGQADSTDDVYETKEMTMMLSALFLLLIVSSLHPARHRAGRARRGKGSKSTHPLPLGEVRTPSLPVPRLFLCLEQPRLFE